MKKTYMLYSNKEGWSLAFGDIKYITEYVSDYITNGNPEELPINANIKSVLKVLNNQDDLMLLEVVSKHNAGE